MTTDDGQTKAPDRYSRQDRETIDRIRDQYGDIGALYFCLGNAMKYQDRAGAKEGVPEDRDRRAADWYAAMARHILAPEQYPDPRSTRSAFAPYRRPPLRVADLPWLDRTVVARASGLPGRLGVAQERVLTYMTNEPQPVRPGDEAAALSLWRAGVLLRRRENRRGGPGAGQPPWVYWR